MKGAIHGYICSQVDALKGYKQRARAPRIIKLAAFVAMLLQKVQTKLGKVKNTEHRIHQPLLLYLMFVQHHWHQALQKQHVQTVAEWVVSHIVHMSYVMSCMHTLPNS